MRLMARCRTIYAGGSVYAFVASTMGDIALVDVKTLFDGSRAAEIILGELSRHRTFVARQRRRVHGVGRQSLGSASA
ncbi:hypothetical protein [Mesorhizobium atlanticum]|uniref:Uncharacterized protein n=1 Tax=Mesorhizobium atlanticum TaxID=2233532 RepID=A0A330GVB8_9HYPH|nr:hypothetical protein [Mesorhizobium atlanticum]RAZ78244.1 hypothetical protein DPM35_06565 [Mesorhizobium atlanticum]